MIITGMADNYAWPLVNVSYAEMIQKRLGPAKANDMMRIYLHDNGSHSTGGGEPGIFQQSIQDLMAWVEQGVAPPPSTRYTIRNGQVILPDDAAERGGLQPVMNLTADGGARTTVEVNQPVKLAAKIEVPPGTGKIVQYNWTVGDSADPATIVEQPQPRVEIDRTLRFDKAGTYVIRLTVYGQRDGLSNPANQTLLRNFKEVRVVVR